ncbi:MAG: hypothetical protein DRH70_05865 [Candidatus Coatesbacteria bacterium]|nr:MAG: hypothetical protein DRH70_05865 [Candidatus Coatesbacteria bacterium]
MKAANLDSRTVALRNKKFYRSIQHGQFYEWQIVALFYSALHMIDYYADVLDKKQYKDHRHRNIFVRKTRNLRPIRGEYKQLYNVSRRARYEGVVFDVQDVHAVLKMHSTVISHVCGLLRDYTH